MVNTIDEIYLFLLFFSFAIRFFFSFFVLFDGVVKVLLSDACMYELERDKSTTMFSRACKRQKMKIKREHNHDHAHFNNEFTACTHSKHFFGDAIFRISRFFLFVRLVKFNPTRSVSSLTNNIC